jgi:excisionase family DNA binding protein
VAYITVKKAADLLQVHPNTIRNWIEAGILRRYQLGKGFKVLLRTEDIEKALGQAENQESTDRAG